MFLLDDPVEMSARERRIHEEAAASELVPVACVFFSFEANSNFEPFAWGREDDNGRSLCTERARK
jgi:hypothetical protein